MTAIATTPVATTVRTRQSGPVSGVPFGRLAVVEARKLVNTRAGRWVLIISLLASAVTAGATAAFIDDVPLQVLFSFAVMAVGMLLPVVAILSATAEWSQRTGLVTFALEPRRVRVLAAKALVAAVAGLVGIVLTLGIAAATMGIATAFGSTGAWTLDWGIVAGNALVTVLGMLQATAFGFVLLNTPAAIVAYFMIPTVWSLATSLSTWFAENSHWIDMGAAGQPFHAGNVGAEGWLHLGVASLVWVVLPMAIGVVRVLKSEIK